MFKSINLLYFRFYLENNENKWLENDKNLFGCYKGFIII